MSCFLRASVLLSKEQSGTVDIANKYKLASILTIYINHSTRKDEANARVMVEKQGSVSLNGFFSAVLSQKAVSAYL